MQSTAKDVKEHKRPEMLHSTPDDVAAYSQWWQYKLSASGPVWEC